MASPLPKLDDDSNAISHSLSHSSSHFQAKKTHDEENTLHSLNSNTLTTFISHTHINTHDTNNQHSMPHLLEDKQNQDQQRVVEAKVFDFRVSLAHKVEAVGCRKKFQHLLPAYLSARISKSHLSLLNIFTKIDNYLLFQKDMRGVKCVLFSDVSRNIFENFNIESGLHNLRQILFLDSSLYKYSYERKRTSFDVRIATNLQDSLDNRRAALRKLIFEFLDSEHQKHLLDNNLESKDYEDHWAPTFSVDIPIPQLDSLETCLKPTWSAQNLQDGESEKPKPTIKKQISLNSNLSLKIKEDSLKGILVKKTEGESFKDKLYRLISEKEQINKSKEKERMELKEVSATRSVGKETYLKVVDEINLIYTMKGISNIFEVNLLQQVCKRTSFNAAEVTQVMRSVVSSSKFLEEKKVEKGTILKLNKEEYNPFRASIQTRTF